MVNQAAISHTTNEVACCGGTMRPPTHTHTHTHIHTAMRVHNAQGELLMLI